MNDEIKRRELAAAEARHTLQQAEQALESARLELEDKLANHIALAHATLDVLTSIKESVRLDYPTVVWEHREALAPLCALYGHRIVESDDRKNCAVVEEIE